MSSTNHTTNYNLSQYVGTDKPTYLGDYNGDMGKIDTAMHNNATSITGVAGDVSTLSSKVGTISNLETTTKSDCVSAINEVNTKSEINKTNIGTISNLETTDKTTVVNAINEIVSKFNLTNVKTYTTYDSIKTGTLPNAYDVSITVATNNDGSVAKIYGGVSAGGFVSGGAFTTIIKTDLRPTSDISIKGKLRTIKTSSTNQTIVAGPYLSTFTIRTNGDLELTSSYSTNGSNVTYDAYLPCIYFLTDFGDTPQ